MKHSRAMRFMVVAAAVALLAAACDAIESDDTPGPTTSTTERLEVLDTTLTTRPGVIPRDESTPSTALRIARHSTTTIPTRTTTTSTTTTTTVPSNPLVPFPDVPPLAIFEAAEARAIHVVSDPYSIDPSVCEGVVWTTTDSNWSAFVVAAPTADGYCEVWLGGQTDNPDFTGNPFLYCLLPESHDPVVVASDANSDWVAEPGLCAPTGFDQG